MSSLPGWLPLSLDALIAEAKRRARHRRFLVAVGVLGAGAISFAGVLAFQPEPGSRSQLPPQSAGDSGAGGSVSTKRLSAVQFSYPTKFYERRFTNCNPVMTGHQGCEHGVMIASYRLLANPTPSRANPNVKAEDVALALYTRPLNVSGTVTLRLRHRSLALWNFQPVSHGGQEPLGNPPPLTAQWWSQFRLNGAAYYAYAWVGAQATKSERASLAQVITSIHALGLRASGPAPQPAPLIERLACGGTSSHPRVPTYMSGGSGYVCAQISGRRCTIWTRREGAPATAAHQTHGAFTPTLCRDARRFLAEHPRGYAIEPRATLVLP